MKCIKENPEEVIKHGKCRKLRFSCVEALPVKEYNKSIQRKRKFETEVCSNDIEGTDSTIDNANEVVFPVNKKSNEMKRNNSNSDIHSVKSISSNYNTNNNNNQQGKGSSDVNNVSKVNNTGKNNNEEEEEEVEKSEEEDEDDDEYESMQQNQLSMLKFIQ